MRFNTGKEAPAIPADVLEDVTDLGQIDMVALNNRLKSRRPLVDPKELPGHFDDDIQKDKAEEEAKAPTFDFSKAPEGLEKLSAYEGSMNLGPSIGTIRLIGMSQAGFDAMQKSAPRENILQDPHQLRIVLREAVVSWDLRYLRGPERGAPVPQITTLNEETLTVVIQSFPPKVWADVQRATMHLSIPSASDLEG